MKSFLLPQTGKTVTVDYQGMRVDFTDKGWFNATAVAERFGKRPVDWLNLDSTKEYIEALSSMLRSEKSSLLKVKRGGRGRSDATWFHPKLAVPFARWCDVTFSIWCDVQIDTILHGNHPHYDWARMRHQASSSLKVMNAILQIQRQNSGKQTCKFHYINEARLINWALTDEFKPVDRNTLPVDELDLLAQLEEMNAVLIGAGIDYGTRKKSLGKFITDKRCKSIEMPPDHRQAICN